MQGYITTGKNDYHMLCQPDYLNIGAQGDGPALNLDDTLKNCYSYKSLTFNNEILTGRTTGRYVNKFQIQDLELFVV